MSRPRKHKTGLPAYVRVKNGAWHYRGRKVCRVSEGESRLYELLAKQKALPVIDRIPAAVAQFKLEYLPTLSPSAAKEHGRLLDVFAEDFSAFPVAQVEATDILRSIRNLYGDKRAAAKAYKSRVSTFFRWCVQEAGLRKDNPCREVWVKKPLRRKTPWTDALFIAVRQRLEPMMQCYHDLSFLLYQRPTEIRLLMWSQDRGDVLRFQPTKTAESTGAVVDIPITPAIRAVLDRAKKLGKLQAGPGGDAPVIQQSDGSTYTRSGIYSAYRRADIALHGEAMLNLNPKAIRPYAATSAKKQGFDIGEIQTGLAQASVRTTEGYIQTHDIPVSPVTLRLPGEG